MFIYEYLYINLMIKIFVRFKVLIFLSVVLPIFIYVEL